MSAKIDNINDMLAFRHLVVSEEERGLPTILLITNLVLTTFLVHTNVSKYFVSKIENNQNSLFCVDAVIKNLQIIAKQISSSGSSSKSRPKI